MHGQRDLGFDLAAASLRSDEPELARQIEIFAAKLESSLPSACRVKRRWRWPLSREPAVMRLDIELGDRSFHLSTSRKGITTERTQRVHDMRRRAEQLSLADWMEALEVALRERATSSSEARVALEELFGG